MQENANITDFYSNFFLYSFSFSFTFFEMNIIFILTSNFIHLM